MDTPNTPPRPRDPGAVVAHLEALTAQVTWLVERQKKQEELLSEMTPILRAVMDTATERLDTLEKRGYFVFGRELVRVGERVVEGFSPEEVRQLGDAIVRILQTVKELTQPEVLAIAGEASRVLQNAHTTEPLGLVGMVKASRDDSVQRGMAVMLELMRHVGRASQAVEAQQRATPAAQRRSRLAEVTGSRRRTEGTPVQGAPAPGASPGPAPGCAVPSSKPAVTAAVIDGVAFTADGHLVDPEVWTEAMAVQLAASQGIELLDAHWAVLRFARADFLETRVTPNIRRITQGTGLSTRDLYALFPKAPARTVARVAGIPKPAGCI
jgi:tRNA 2-thiouridine synthesizing protein E